MDTTIDILNINIDPYSKSLSVKPGEGSDHLQPSFNKYIKKKLFNCTFDSTISK